jgi:hypothetical protein
MTMLAFCIAVGYTYIELKTKISNTGFFILLLALLRSWVRGKCRNAATALRCGYRFACLAVIPSGRSPWPHKQSTVLEGHTFVRYSIVFPLPLSSAVFTSAFSIFFPLPLSFAVLTSGFEIQHSIFSVAVVVFT